MTPNPLRTPRTLDLFAFPSDTRGWFRMLVVAACLVGLNAGFLAARRIHDPQDHARERLDARLLWGALVAFSYLTTDIGKILGLEKGLRSAVIGSGGCFLIGLAALLGSLAAHWLVRREAKRSQRLGATLQRAREVTLESCLRRIGSLLAETTAVVRIARAHVICTLPELDGTGKGYLIGWLQSVGALSRLALAGADLRSAVLAGTDLSAAALAGVNLSGAHLTGARLVQADLHGSQLQGADLSSADAGGANLRDVDLREARLHRCNLRQADLRGANLERANLWQADVTGARLQGARLIAKQLASVLGGAAEPDEESGERL
ncbi:MAG TPA: pentapeptide repeat-containing protein [Thermoanaerobaculia bacterium]|nr:pentapeptide repeat-containing protein [Thermoanaerobaculia bacterium]